jgi:S-DNA-T family DNA segregation ATPase FtsK/SpoIIIE
LRTLAVALLRAHCDVVVVGPASSPLATVDWPRAAFGNVAEVSPLLGRLGDELPGGGQTRPIVLVFDDVDYFDRPELAPILDRLAESDALRIVGSLESRAMSGYTASALIDSLRRARRLVLLQPEPAEVLQITGVKVDLRPGLRMPPGRAVLFADRTPTVVQIAVASDRSAPSPAGRLGYASSAFRRS